jgi:RNA polymerase sigma-70 factor, ECF subfamily
MRQLYERHARTVYAFARSMTGSADIAEDVMQETFLHAARDMGSFEGRSAFLTWLLRVARSAAADHGRAAERRGRDQGREPPYRSQIDPADAMEGRELTEAVRQAVGRLPEPERAAVTLCELQELSVAQAAEALGWTESRIKSALMRARGRLRVMLASQVT